jgi:acyl-CoA thioesterase
MNPELTVENIKKVFNEMEGFSSHNKMKIEELEDEKAVLSAIVDEKAVNPSNICHGGLVFGLADTAMGTLAYLTGRKVVAVDSNISY